MPFCPPCTHPGCTKMGVFGERVALLKGEDGTWYCSEHAPERLKRPNQYKHTPNLREVTINEPEQRNLF